MRSTLVNTLVKKMEEEKKKIKKLKPWNGKYYNILSKFEGWGPTEVAYIKKKKCIS